MNFSSQDLSKLTETSAGGIRILVSSHVNPDPDAIGSVLAAEEMLWQLGAAPVMILENGFAPRCLSLPGAERIQSLAETIPEQRFNVAVIVDCGSLSRIGEVERLLLPGATIFNIDHHISNDRFGIVNWVDLESSATGELLFLLCRELNLSITPELASNLFAGILTDTGRFRFSSTTPRSLLVAADLVALGASPAKITNALYYDLPSKDLRSMGRIYDTLELHCSGLVSILLTKRENLVEDPDSIVDLALSIRGVEVAALISEADNGKIRISLRSKTRVNVSEIAASLGGGGHERAAGFRMSGTLESARDRIVPILVNATRENEAHANTIPA